MNHPTPNPSPSENPRMLLAEFLDRYLSRPGALETFLERVARAVKAPTELSYRNFVWSVRAGRRAIPNGAEEAWGRCLGLLPETPEWLRFLHLVHASRAYGKTNGRTHLAYLQGRNAALEEEARTLKLRLAKAEEALSALESEVIRLRADCD